MPDYGECRHAEIRAPRERCYSALLDVDALPRWQRALREARVLERDAEGRPAVLEYVVDAKVRTVRYRIRQSYRPPEVIRSEYLGGDFRDFGGEWRFAALAPDRTRVELDLRIDPGRLVPGPVRSLIADAVMRRALDDLKAHLEG
jgi:ribosome-associated toxin RatA of RatAB toxin-antitoxin module